MRKFLISLMAASMLVPAVAHAKEHDSDRGDRQRSERSERSSSSDRPQRAERPARAERSERPARTERQRVDRADRQPQIQRQVERRAPVQVERSRPVERVRRVEGNNDSLLGGLRTVARRQQEQERVDTRRDRDRDGRRDWRRDRDGDGRDWRRDGDNDRRWSRDWRRDDRYNWYSYRSRYGSLFRLGRYYDPYGHRYRRFSIGFNLWPSYYGSSFWLNDPWQYRLPPAYGPYRWVRYYDDALLVNIYSGQVVDVIYNVFW